MFLQKGRGLLIVLQTHEFQLLIMFDKGTPYLLQTHLVLPKPGLYKSNNTLLFNVSTSPLTTQKCIASCYHLLPRKRNRAAPPASWPVQSGELSPRHLVNEAVPHTGSGHSSRAQTDAAFTSAAGTSGCVSALPEVPQHSSGDGSPSTQTSTFQAAPPHSQLGLHSQGTDRVWRHRQQGGCTSRAG